MAANRVEQEMVMRAGPAQIATADDEAMSLVCTMASEEPVRRWDGQSGEIVDEVLLAGGMKTAPKVPLLNAHSRGSVENVLGHIEDIKIEGSLISGRAVFDKKDPLAVAAFNKYRAGHLTDFSVGYHIADAVMVSAGQTADVNGRTWKAPEDRGLKLATNWTIKELSAVPIGADPMAKARGEDKSQAGLGGAPQKNKERNMEGKDAAVTVPPVDQDEAKRELEVVTKKAVEEGRKLERQRAEEIATAMKGVELSDEQAEKVRACETADQARKLILEAIVSRQAPAAIVRPVESQDDTMRAIECGAVRTAGLSEEFCVKEYGARVFESSKRYKNIGPMGICRGILRASGRHVPDDAVEVVRDVFGLAGRSDASSTTHLGFILGNIANKSLLQGYNEQNDTWSKWCARREVPDYKLNTAARFGMADGFAEVGDGGEVKHTSATEEGETFQVKLYAEGFSITEKQLVNDDQGVFASVPQRLGAAARRYISKQVYTTVLANGTMNDGKYWLGTDHSNYISGTDTVMDATYAVSGLDKAMAKILQQTGLEGEPLDLQPSILLVPPELAKVADAVFKSDMIVSGITARVASTNPYAGRFTVLVEPRLSNTGYSGYSAAKWYLIDPRVENFLVAFLRGNSEPRIESFQMESATFGIKYRASLRFGVKATDYRGMCLSAGA